jgi:hypothetical protein
VALNTEFLRRLSVQDLGLYQSPIVILRMTIQAFAAQTAPAASLPMRGFAAAALSLRRVRAAPAASWLSALQTDFRKRELLRQILLKRPLLRAAQVRRARERRGLRRTARAARAGPALPPRLKRDHLLRLPVRALRQQPADADPDRALASAGGRTSNHTNLGGADANDTGIDGKQVFTGEKYFTVKEIEVFSVSLEINSFSFTIFGCPEWISALTGLLPESNHAAAGPLHSPRHSAVCLRSATSGRSGRARAEASRVPERGPAQPRRARGERAAARDFRGGCGVRAKALGRINPTSDANSYNKNRRQSGRAGGERENR